MGATATGTFAQESVSLQRECRLTNLSKKYIYLITADKSKNEYGGLQTSKTSVEIIRKIDGQSMQRLFIKPGKTSLGVDSFSDCSAVGSYISGKHARDEGADNYWGDFMVADFNFDGLEDLAVITNSSNTGAFYEFLTQTKSGRFVKDTFLSDGYFPYKIDRRNKTLTTGTAATTWGWMETVLKYNPRTRKWRVLKEVHQK